ncbi:MAG: hypothetical protein R3331_04480 [Sulfurospirillaceae bacterium]|nr:hypothetical protein [Sulfurospirillaceae bacterium]
MSKIELLLETIPSYPGQNIAIITDGTDEKSILKLIEFSRDIDANLYIKELDSTKLQSDGTVHIEKFSFEDTIYNSKSIQYDFLFLFAKFDDTSHFQSIAKKIYRAIKNAANLFVLTNKENSNTLVNILEETNFVAINMISLEDEFDAISAKKMHGWMRV